MLSILVTYYNQEKFVSRSLDSIFNQKLTEDFEVLVGDDGSTDNTCNIVKEYILRYPGKIKLFIQPRDNSKQYSAVERASYNRLNLLYNSTGDYVCFLDGDDEYCDFTWMQESIDILNSNRKLVGVAHNYKETYEDGSVVIPDGISGYDFISAKLYCKQLYTPAGTILFRRVLNENFYNKLITLKSFDDNDITFYFLNFGDLYCVDKIVYNYYQNTGSIWNSTNALEKSIINAIDYEIVKKILSKYHTSLLFKYFGALFSCYKNKDILCDKKFEKYRNQCIPNGLLDTFFNWRKKSWIIKSKTNVEVFYYLFLFIIIKISNQISRLFQRGK